MVGCIKGAKVNVVNTGQESPGASSPTSSGPDGKPLRPIRGAGLSTCAGPSVHRRVPIQGFAEDRA
jgi:hypothetical protein